MDLREKEELIRLVTEQVLGALTSAEIPQEEGKRKILVVGKLCRVSETAARGAVLLPLEDYQEHQNILRYDGVHITRLTLTELADTALGQQFTGKDEQRDGDQDERLDTADQIEQE